MLFRSGIPPLSPRKSTRLPAKAKWSPQTLTSSSMAACETSCVGCQASRAATGVKSCNPTLNRGQKTWGAVEQKSTAPRAPARGILKWMSELSVAFSPPSLKLRRALLAIHPRPSGRGILAKESNIGSGVFLRDTRLSQGGREVWSPADPLTQGLILSRLEWTMPICLVRHPQMEIS